MRLGRHSGYEYRPDLAASGACLAAYADDVRIIDRDVAVKGGSTGAINDFPIANYLIVHFPRPPLSRMRHFKANPLYQRLAFSSYTMAVTRELNWISRRQIKLVGHIIQIAFVLKPELCSFYSRSCSSFLENEQP
jgi:hypothetical protein